MHWDMYSPCRTMIFILCHCGLLWQIFLFQWVVMWQPSCSLANIGLAQRATFKMFEDDCGSWLTMVILAPRWICNRVPISVKKKPRLLKNSGESWKNRR